jgi:outer membrane protein assembly factor BamB
MHYGGGNLRKVWRGSWIQIVGVVGVLALVIVAVVNISRPDVHATLQSNQGGSWPTFLQNNGRTGYNGADIINSTTAPNLRQHWMRKITGQLSSEPVVANGMIYWGSWSGVEHASRLSDGTDVWATTLGKRTPDCRNVSLGILSTATEATVPIGGVTKSVVFVGGNDTQLYALDANTGAILWHTSLGTPPSNYLYSATAVFNGSVYIGVSGSDCSYVQAKVVQVNASTGAIQNTFITVPNGCTGASVWSSPAIDEANGILYFTTGEQGTCSTNEPFAIALVALRASDLSLVSSWRVPKAAQQSDGDFGATPTLFQATINGVSHQMVGVINKNGFYYAFDRTNISAGPLWQTQLAVRTSTSSTQDSISSSAWDGTALYVAAARTTINNQGCPGSLSALNPANGAILWRICLGFNAKDPVTVVPGVVVIGAGTALILVNAATGQQLFSFHDTNSRSNFWGPASISNGVLYQVNDDGIVYAFGM